MKVGELREKLKGADPERVNKAFAEVYKALPKAKKDEMDPIIAQILSGEDVKQQKKAKTDLTPAEVELLFDEIDEFLYNAEAGYYFEPNRVIPKKDRPRWRFDVKRFIKELSSIQTHDANFERSGEYLLKLYNLISEACYYYKFNTEAPYRSIGMAQQDLFHLTALRLLDAKGYTKETIYTLLQAVSGCGLSTESLHADMFLDLVNLLKIPDLRRTGIECAKQLIASRDFLFEGDSYFSLTNWREENAVQDLDSVVLLLEAILGEMDEAAMAWYFETSTERTDEIALYVGLEYLDWGDRDKDWVTLYEYAVMTRKIKPREELKKWYGERVARS